MAYAMTNAVSTANVVANTETTVAVIPALPYSPTGSYQGMAVTGYVNVTNNTSTTMVVRVRNGSSTAGTVIGAPMTLATTSVAVTQIPFAVLDTTNPPASQYNLTLTPTSGTGTAVTNSVYLQMDPVIL